MKYLNILVVLVLLGACTTQSETKEAEVPKETNKFIVEIPDEKVAQVAPKEKETEKGVKEIEEITEIVYTDTKYRDASLDFTHKYSKQAHPFIAASLIDLTRDGIDEVFLGGGIGQDDKLFSFVDGAFKETQSFPSSAASFGATSIDIDNDDDTDLVVTRQDGIYLLRNTKGVLAEEKLDITLDPNTVALSVTHGDYNNDGWTDLYFSTMKSAPTFKTASFNNPANYAENKLFAGSKEGFADVTEESQTGLNQNSFTASFIDLDADGWQDLVVAVNTDRIRIYHNQKDGSFKEVEVPNKYAFWMGLAVDDFNNDSLPDLLFSNIGTTISTAIAKGDSRSDQPLTADYLYLENQGAMQFAEKTQEAGFTGLGFGWGTNFTDLNLDGNKDVLVAQSYIKWPPHKLKKLPGTILQGGKSLQDVTSDWNLENKAYGITQLISDFNRDGTPDIIFANISGDSYAKLSQGQENNFIALQFTDSIENAGIRIEVKAGDKTQNIFHGINSGMGSDSFSSNRIIGIGKAKGVQVNIYRGKKRIEAMEMKANTAKTLQ